MSSRVFISPNRNRLQIKDSSAKAWGQSVISQNNRETHSPQLYPTQICYQCPTWVGKNHDFFQKNKKIAYFLFKSDFLDLNQIMIYIRIFQFLLGYSSYNCHNYVNNLAEQVCNQSRL